MWLLAATAAGGGRDGENKIQRCGKKKKKKRGLKGKKIYLL